MIFYKKSIMSVFLGAAVIAMVSCDSTQNKKDTSLIPGFDLANLDTTVSPTDDFFQFSSGGWQKNNTIPETESIWGAFNILREDSQEKIKGLVLEAESKKGEKGSDTQLIGDFYKSAMDSTGIENAGLKPIKFEFDRIDALKSYKDFPKFYAESFMIGSGTPFGFYIGADQKDSKSTIGYTYQSGLSLPDRDYYIGESERFQKIREKYKQHITNMFVLSGDSKEKAEKNTQIIFDIEHEIAVNSMSRIEQRDPVKTYNKMTIAELQNLTPNFNWNMYFDGLNVKNENVIVTQIDFLKNTSNQLKTTSLENWKIYFKWHALSGSASWLPNSFAKENFAFKSGVLRGVTVMKSRQKRASRLTNSILGEPLGKLFVAKYFPESSKKNVEELIENLRLAYIERVKQLDWMSEETKEKAIEKLHAFTYKIGYPNKWKDYSSLDIKPTGIIANFVEINRWGAQENLDKLGKPVDKSEWGMTPQTINAYYNPVNNEVVFPAGILQPPFYSPDADVAINYGAIGGVIGHEFSHGFDDSGSKYDKDGNLNDWWTVDDRAKFDAKTKVVVGQFNKFEPYEGVFVQGELTLGENIADLGGLTLGYYALQKYYENNKGAREDLGGYTPEQRFYLGWAQVWQSISRPEYTKQQVTTDPHSPAEYRVNGPMSNLEEFRKAWGGKEGDKMVRTGEEQAIIW